jgi:hypothetical protein
MTTHLFSTVVAQIEPTTLVWGYLDPGAGSMLFQVLIAGLLSTMFFAKNSVQLVRARLFARKAKT